MIGFTDDNEVRQEEHFTAILVGADLGRGDAARSLAELEALAEAAGGETAGLVIQKMDRPRPATFIGKGKVAEIAQMLDSGTADTVIFDDRFFCWRALEDSEPWCGGGDSGSRAQRRRT